MLIFQDFFAKICCIFYNIPHFISVIYHNHIVVFFTTFCCTFSYSRCHDNNMSMLISHSSLLSLQHLYPCTCHFYNKPPKPCLFGPIFPTMSKTRAKLGSSSLPNGQDIHIATKMRHGIIAFPPARNYCNFTFLQCSRSASIVSSQRQFQHSNSNTTTAHCQSDHPSLPLAKFQIAFHN